MSDSVDLLLLEPYLAEVGERGRTMLLPALHHAQSLYGWLPREVQQAVSRALRVPLAEIHGVIEFYTMFYNQPTAKRVIRVCEDSACSLAGSKQVMDSIEAELGLKHGETSVDGMISYEHVPCLGMCELAPCALDGVKPAGNLQGEQLPAFLDGTHPSPTAKPYGKPRWMTRRIGVVDPNSMTDYETHDGYQALKTAITQSPIQLIETVEKSGILGRGGAMFPTGRKWRFTRNAPGTPNQKHIIANADESEPGTFKDRCLMEEDPFALIEGMTISAYAVGAEKGWIFVRGEYPRSYKRLQNAVAKARQAGYLGRDILGVSGFHFDIEIRLGAGAYICGEETALFEAIEGKRGFPRIKPPFPTTHGLFNQPTTINNVETFVAVAAMLHIGLDEWRSVGTENSPGSKLFCLSGHIARPGLYELPFGATIRELITMAGGVPSGKSIQAVLMGGAAGIFIGEEQLDMSLTYESAKECSVPLGSGAVMVFDESADLTNTMFELARFFAHESCGKCFPCQLGTQRQMEILQQMAQGEGVAGDRQRLHDIGFTMTETSLCGLGQTAASAVLSGLALVAE